MPMLLQIRRRGHRQNARVEQLARDQRRHRRLAKADCNVETVADHIAQLVARDQFELQIGMFVDETAESRSEHEARKERVHVHAQASAHGRRASGGAGRRVLEAA